MLTPPSDSQPTGSSVALGGAALAAGAMLAGFALHKKSTLPLAAGLAAAAASLRLITKTKDEGTPLEVFSEPPSCEGFHACPESKFQVLDEDAFEEDDAADWVSSDAVLFEHVVPAGCPMPAPPQPQQALAVPASPHATSFPLLDDDGNPVASLQALPSSMSPAFAEAADEFGFPLGPLVWEPDESDQHCLESEGNTVWFGPSDIVQAPAPPAWTAPVLLANTVVPTAVTPVAITPARVPGPPSTPESVSSILESLRTEATAREDMLVESAPSLPEPSAAIAKSTSPQEPLSFADWMLSTQTTAAVAPSSTEVVSRTPIKTALPAPRHPGRAPRSEAEDPYASPMHSPAVEGGRRHPLMSRVSKEERAPDGPPPPSPALVYHRSVAPMAPVQLEEPPSTRGPLTMVLVALILMVVLLAVAMWGDGQLSGKAKAPPWSQDPLPAKEQVTTAKAPAL